MEIWYWGNKPPYFKEHEGFGGFFFFLILIGEAANIVYSDILVGRLQSVVDSTYLRFQLY